MNKLVWFVILCAMGFLPAMPQGRICAAPARAEEAAPLPLINLDVKNMVITDVLRLLAEEGKVNIIASRNVQGRVTAKLQNVTVEQALNAILDTNSFVYRREHDIIKVFTPQDILQQEQIETLFTRVFSPAHVKAADLRQVLNSVKSPRGRVEINSVSNQVIVTDTEKKLVEVAEAIAALDCSISTEIFNLSYSKAKDIQTKLVELIPKQEGDVFIDERTNSIVIRAIPGTIDKARAIIRNWDKRSAQVLIEAKILEVSLDKTTGMGINWEYQSSGEKSVRLAATLPANITSGGIFKIGTLTHDEYQITIQTLESSTQANVISSPRIVVIDNTEANILIGSAEPYKVVYIDRETSVQTEETKFIDVGVKLRVTPQISRDDFITMKIHPEVSSARRVAEVNNALAVDTTQADTTVVVKDGQTIVLGGLIKEGDTKLQTKIPVLGDIPLLGYLFKGWSKGKEKKEIVVFITPHILQYQNGQDEFLREQAVERAIRAVDERLRLQKEVEGE